MEKELTTEEYEKMFTKVVLDDRFKIFGLTKKGVLKVIQFYRKNNVDWPIKD